MSIDREKLKSVMVAVTLVGFAYLSVTVGCSGLTTLVMRASLGSAIERVQAKAQELNLRIESDLPPGASAEDIEVFLTRHEILFSYDRFQNRYQGIVRIDRGSGVSVYLYVDSNKRFVRGEAQTYFTFL